VKKPMLVAKFLQQTRGLNKAVIGDFLAKDAPFNAQVCRRECAKEALYRWLKTCVNWHVTGDACLL